MNYNRKEDINILNSNINKNLYGKSNSTQDNLNIKRGLKTKLITLAGILGLTFAPLKSLNASVQLDGAPFKPSLVDTSLTVTAGNQKVDSTNIVSKFKYTDDSNVTVKKDSLNVQTTILPKDSLLLESKNVENLIEKVYQTKTKKLKSITQKEKDQISEIYFIYSDSIKNNKYGLSANRVSNLFEIKNALDLKTEIKNLSLSIGEESNFRDDSREKVQSSFLKISNLYNLLNGKEQKSKLTNKILEDTRDYIKKLESSTATLLEEEYDFTKDIYAPGLSQKIKEDLEIDLNYGTDITFKTSNILNGSNKVRLFKNDKKKQKKLSSTKKYKRDSGSIVNFNVGYGTIIDGKSYAKLGLDTRILKNTKLNISAVAHYSTNEKNNPETTFELPDGSTIFAQESFKEEYNGIGGQISLEQEFFKYFGAGLKYVYIPIKTDITTTKNEGQRFSDGTSIQNSTTSMSFDREDVLYAGIEGKIRIPYKNLELVFKPGMFYNFDYNPKEEELDKKLEISNKPVYGLEAELLIKPFK